MRIQTRSLLRKKERRLNKLNSEAKVCAEKEAVLVKENHGSLPALGQQERCPESKTSSTRAYLVKMYIH